MKTTYNRLATFRDLLEINGRKSCEIAVTWIRDGVEANTERYRGTVSEALETLRITDGNPFNKVEVYIA